MWLLVVIFIISVWCVISPFLPKERQATQTIVYVPQQTRVAEPQVTHSIVNNYVDNRSINYHIYNSAPSQSEPKYIRSEEGLFGNQNNK
jgi:hypothetical protein